MIILSKGIFCKKRQYETLFMMKPNSVRHRRRVKVSELVKLEKIAISDALPLDALVAPAVVHGFNYETHNAPVYKCNDSAIHITPGYKVTARSQNQRLSY